MGHDVEVIRKANLVHLIRTTAGGNVTLFAEMVGCTQSQMNQWVTDRSTSRAVRWKSARKVEQLVGLPANSLDELMDGAFVAQAYTPMGLDAVLRNTALCVEVIASLLESAGPRARLLYTVIDLLVAEPTNQAYRNLLAIEIDKIRAAGRGVTPEEALAAAVGAGAGQGEAAQPDSE